MMIKEKSYANISTTKAELWLDFIRLCRHIKDYSVRQDAYHQLSMSIGLPSDNLKDRLRRAVRFGDDGVSL